MLQIRDLWAREHSPYKRNRIPGMIVTSRGTLIVYNEARMEGSDWAQMDIFMQRSEDGGETFLPPLVLARGTETHPTVNNPVMMEDGVGAIHFLYCEDYGIRGGRILHRISTDDGLSWGDATDITASTLPFYRNAFALGPGHGIRTQDGTLVVPVWMVPKCYEQEENAHVPSCISTLYSKDNGAHFQLGDVLVGTEEIPSPNETELALLPDGRIYLNARMRRPRRAVAYSKNGYSGWTPLKADEALVCPMSFGSCVAYAHGGTSALLFSNCNSETARDHVTVRASFDGGATFPHALLLDETRGGYVETAVDNATGRIYVLYETDWGKTCRLATMTLDDITGTSH